MVSYILYGYFDWHHSHLVCCCIHSGVCYTGRLATLLQCPHCQENQFDEYGNPCHHFGYIPLIPWLQGFFQSKEQIKLMSYQSNYEPSKDSMSDVFDSAAYQVLCQKKVMVDGQELGHKYYQDSQDIAFSFCIDSYLLFKNRGGPSATPLLLLCFWKTSILIHQSGPILNTCYALVLFLVLVFPKI